MDQEASVDEVIAMMVWTRRGILQLPQVAFLVGEDSLLLCHLNALKEELVALLQGHRRDRRVEEHEQIVVERKHVRYHVYVLSTLIRQLVQLGMPVSETDTLWLTK